MEVLDLRSNVREWFERFEFYILAENLETTVAENAPVEAKTAAAKKNLAIFINKCDAQIYKLMKSLCSPADINSMKYADMKKLIIDHLDPKATKFAERYKFNKIVQEEGQSASDFIS